MLLAKSIPTVSAEFFEELDRTFKLVSPEPNVTTMDELMFNAGARSVVEWIRIKAVRSSTITGGPDVSIAIDVRQT